MFGQSNFHRNNAFSQSRYFEEIAMRPVIVVLLACLTLAACGSSRKTVIVNPPPDSTTVIDRNGDARVIVPN